MGRNISQSQAQSHPDLFDALSKWLDIARAVIEIVPHAKFGGPDVGSSADWVVHFGDEVSKILGDRLIELTGHYYAEGPPDSPSASIENLLADDPYCRAHERAAVKYRARWATNSPERAMHAI